MSQVDFNVDMIQYVVLFFLVSVVVSFLCSRRNAAGVYAVFGSDVRFYLLVVERACEDCGFSWRSL
jgi:hypothetical protein